MYKNKESLKNYTTKDLGFTEECHIFINESLAFDTKKLLLEVWGKCHELGIKKIMTDNGIIKIKCNEMAPNRNLLRISLIYIKFNSFIIYLYHEANF